MRQQGYFTESPIFTSDNLWQYSLNSISVSDRFQCASVKPTDSFSTETKQTYSNSIKILFTNINHKMTEVERKPLTYLYHLNLEANPSNKNAISKKHEYNIEKYRMHSTDFWGTCDCLDWFIHIFKHILQKRLWYGFLLDLKEKPSVAWNLWKIEKSIACLCDRKK